MINRLNNPIKEDMTILKRWIRENKEYFQLCWKKHLETYNQQKLIYYNRNKERNNEKSKEYREKNKGYFQKYREKHKEESKKLGRKYYEEHKEEIKAYRKEYIQEHKEYFKRYGNKYRSKPENKDRINKQVKKRCKEDPVFRLIHNLRIGVVTALKQYSKTGKIIKSKDLGIDYKAIIEHLKPLPKNIRDYQIHHIKPLASFNFNNLDGTLNIKVVEKAFAPENTQLLIIQEHRNINHFDLINKIKQEK